MIRSRAYLSALVLAALLGIPISAVAYGFLALVGEIQELPVRPTCRRDLFDGWHARPGGRCPGWCSAGCSTALTIRYLPGNGGPLARLRLQDRRRARQSTASCPGIVLAALTTLSLGAVLGPEAPLIAIGGGLAALTVHLVKKDAPPMAVTIMASAGSFAAISTLLGSPLLGAFLIMEAAGIAGATLSLVALPGLLASGIGALVFVGLDNWTGLGTFSLALHHGAARRWTRRGDDAWARGGRRRSARCSAG